MTGKFLRLFVRGILVLVAAMPVSAAEKITFLHVNDVYEISPWEISPRPGLAGLAQLMSLLKAERAAVDGARAQARECASVIDGRIALVRREPIARE